MNEREPWVCPLCGRALAPHVDVCPCASPVQAQTGGADGWRKLAQTGVSATSAHRGSKILGSKARTSPRSLNYQDYPAFMQFWEVYPSNRDKKRALSAWVRYVVAPGADVKRVIDAAQAYRDDPLRKPDATKYAEGWLSGERWEDELDVARPETPLDTMPVYGSPAWNAASDAEYERIREEEAHAEELA